MTKLEAMNVLGLSQGYTEEQRKKAFRKLSKTCHPDFYKEDPVKCEEFKRLNEANQILEGKILPSDDNIKTGAGSPSPKPSGNNTGFPPGTVCPKCFGTGKVEKLKRMPFGNVVINVDCDFCGGKGNF